MKKLSLGLIALDAGFVALMTTVIVLTIFDMLVGMIFGNTTQVHIDRYFWYSLKVLSIGAFAFTTYSTFKHLDKRNARVADKNAVKTLLKNHKKLIYSLVLSTIAIILLFNLNAHNIINGLSKLLFHWDYFEGYTP
jgi:heme O synthase-like polyprenyltransferase